MIYHYFNCPLDYLEDNLNKHAKDGFKLEELSIHGCTAHVVMSYDLVKKTEDTKQVYKKVKNDNL
jgi:hypothetical protein